MPYIVLIVFLALALTLQFLTGDFPVQFFAFPLNLILALLWAGGILYIWNHKRKSLFVSFFLSRGATFTAIILFATFCLVIGLTGMRLLVRTWLFVAFMFYFQTVLLFVLLRGWRTSSADDACRGTVRWRFLLNHAGLLLAVSSAFWGAPDSKELRLQTYRDIPVREAYAMDGTVSWLPYEIILKDFDVETYENGIPSMYAADVIVDGKSVVLKVNHPYSISFGEDIYLSGYDSMSGAESEYCILQIVREPWKYGAAAGIIMMLAGALMLFAAGPGKYNRRED